MPVLGIELPSLHFPLHFRCLFICFLSRPNDLSESLSEIMIFWNNHHTFRNSDCSEYKTKFGK